jgi:hypothetical protein
MPRFTNGCYGSADKLGQVVDPPAAHGQGNPAASRQLTQPAAIEHLGTDRPGKVLNARLPVALTDRIDSQLINCIDTHARLRNGRLLLNIAETRDFQRNFRSSVTSLLVEAGEE